MDANMLQFAPMHSFINPTFWHKLSDLKIDKDRLSDAPKSIMGYYTNRNSTGCLLDVDYSSFNSYPSAEKYYHAAVGTIYNKNTIEEFKECNKKALIQAEGQKLIKDFKSGVILKKPYLLARFFVLSFADLKNHNYYYWFGFPCPMTPTLNLILPVKQLSNLDNYEIFETIINSVPYKVSNFFVISAELIYFTLEEALTDKSVDLENCYFCFSDPSGYKYPAWFMRVYVAFIYQQCPQLIGKIIKFISIRYNKTLQLDESLIWQVKQNEPNDFENLDKIQFVGWEANRNDKMGPRVASMHETMDPKKLAENSIYLNLKLMQWRLVPNLNLEILQKTKCLIFGAGTLGCAVSRNLLSWGFKHFTFIDSGKISYSNPVRQCLYTHADAVKGDQMKATTAANRLLEINPSAYAHGFNVQIPMPGHPVGESMMDEVDKILQLIEDLVKSHHAIFLLTDSRESRWLPTMLGAFHGKIVINAALGFDSYLVMRHGATRPKSEFDEIIDIQNKKEVAGLKCIMGKNLGCYFCNDVTAPGNSLKDRTLDQQCTVTRPGVSNIAASYAVELLVSLLQHPLRDEAPAYYANSKNLDAAKIPEGILGIIPHSIRGTLCNYENILPGTERFKQCIACSMPIRRERSTYGNEFFYKAFASAKYLEDLTGISSYNDLENEIIDFDDAELEMLDD